MGKWRQARSLKSAKASQSFLASQSAKGAGGRNRTRPEGRNRTRNVRSPFRTGGRNRTRTCQKPDRRGILERVETEREGVKTERGVHFMWQAQRCGSVTCKDMVRYDISCIRDRHAIVDRVEAERGGARSRHFDHVLWCFPEKRFDIPSKPFPHLCSSLIYTPSSLRH